jgi:hypothetical protein
MIWIKRWLKRARTTADPAGDLIAIMRRHADDADCWGCFLLMLRSPA